MSKNLLADQENNRKYLRLVILTIRVLAKHGMSFQGKTPDSSNFMAMLESHMDATEKYHKMHKTKDYQHSKIQNEIIKIFMT